MRTFTVWGAVLLSCAASAGAEIRLPALEKGGGPGREDRVRTFPDDPRYDLRPGLVLSCQVKFDIPPAEGGQMELICKGGSNTPGSYILRVDGPKEGVKFSFFVNLGTGPEPRVSVKPASPITPGKWYEVAAGWDGTNTWITVDGMTNRLRRVAASPVPGCPAPLVFGPLVGTLRDPAVQGPPRALPKNPSITPGFRIGCDATFLVQPSGETTLVNKGNEYWLRYDRRKGEATGSFNFFVNLDGAWEPRAFVRSAIETGRVYSISAGWDGSYGQLDVDDLSDHSTRRSGRCRATDSPLRFGPKESVKIGNFAIRNDPRVIVQFGTFRTRELMPTAGRPASLIGKLVNIGFDLENCVLTAAGRHGATVTPAKIAVGKLAMCAERPLEWTVDPGTNGFVHIAFTLERDGQTVCRAYKRIVFMPEQDPPMAAKGWAPPIRPMRTFHVDSAAGDDAQDGLTPATAWKSFRNILGKTLGPGERLLLKRGSVFNEDLTLSATGAPGNWAEIGAYGTGMRPQIRRNRHLNDRCGFVAGAAYLVVHDLIFCNAGSGFTVSCSRPGDGHVLIERCLAHHIEGMYRFNSHGIPEWRDEPGPVGGSRSYGMAVSGRAARDYVMRDCESYQCSSGFHAAGVDAFVTRMFSHDNVAHNTSPHPYNLTSRSWMTDCVFDASGWHAAAGTMGVMLAGNDGFIIRGCHFVNQPDSGSPDQGGIDFEASGENCRIERCTFRNNAGAAIEVLGLRSPQTRNVHILANRFERDNWAYKNGPAEIQVWGAPTTPESVACSNGRIEDNGYVLVPGVPFYTNNTRTASAWTLAGNRAFDFAADLNRAFPYADPPAVRAGGEIWTDVTDVALEAQVDDAQAAVMWEQIEGPAGVAFMSPDAPCTKAVFPGEGDYRVNVKADNGTLWRTSRTAVHVLPKGARTFLAWDFAKNLDRQGWRVEGSGMDYEFIPGKTAFWNSKSHPVRLVCGDYFVIAMKNAGAACLISRDECDTGISFGGDRANAVRVRMQNHTTSTRMRLWWQTNDAPVWNERNSVAFDVTPMDADDAVYTIRLPRIGGVKQFKLAFSADGTPVTGTCRIDYIWAGRL